MYLFDGQGGDKAAASSNLDVEFASLPRQLQLRLKVNSLHYFCLVVVVTQKISFLSLPSFQLCSFGLTTGRTCKLSKVQLQQFS